MQIIDCHVHTNFTDKRDKEFEEKCGIDFSPKGLQAELAENKVEALIAIATAPESVTPGEADYLLRQASRDKRFYPVCGIHPEHVGKKDLEKLETVLAGGRMFGIKIWPGYFPVAPDDKRYYPLYDLAGAYKVPVVIHTGDTYGSDNLVKYAHPLAVDKMAVKFPRTTFVIAHLGNPWIPDAAEVVYKNANVYADISAMCIGGIRSLPYYVEHNMKYALSYIGTPDKLMYGSDWPLVRMKDYVRLMKKAVPEKFHRKIFFENANRVFRMGLK
ncbi:amidohydrolase family protein [Candidatus Woesearchaeota archaeon]|nr:amidohydrolase family protein [Candidatus Woesearchaeota archaeon]